MAKGCQIKIAITPGNAHDLTAASELLSDLTPGGMLLADRAYDADWLRAKLRTRRSWANIPPKSNRKRPVVFSPWLYKKRNLIERFFSKLKRYRRIATRYDKLGATFLAMTKLACVRLILRHNESTAYIESFNGKFRAECLNAHWFRSLDDARAKMEDWRRDYNEFRPHSAIGNKVPISLMNGLSAPPAEPSPNPGKFQRPLAQNRGAPSRNRKPLLPMVQRLGAARNRRGSNRCRVKLQWQFESCCPRWQNGWQAFNTPAYALTSGANAGAGKPIERQEK